LRPKPADTAHRPFRVGIDGDRQRLIDVRQGFVQFPFVKEGSAEVRLVDRSVSDERGLQGS